MSTTNTLSARLIGAIFLERGLVTEEQLQSALALQVQTKEHLGEILVQHFGVSRIELASVLAEQWAELERANAGAAGTSETSTTAEPDEHTPPRETAEGESENGPGLREDAYADEAQSPRPLGAIFVEQGLVTDAELDRALETQGKGGEKLGEILVAQGSITRLQLASALAEQWTALRKIRPPSASEPQASAPTAIIKETPPADLERLHEAVDALEQRLRAAESVAAREPWREEISASTEGLQASVREIEARLEGAATREELEAIEDMRVALDELKSRVATLADSEPTNDPELLRRVETAAEAATAARSSLDGAFESLSLRLADVESRVHDRSDITKLQGELEGLVVKSVSESDGERDNGDLEELRGEVQRLADEVSRRAAAASDPDPALAKRVEKLTVRVEEIGSALKGFEGGKKAKGDADALRDALATLVERVGKLEAGGNTDLQELRRSLSELEARVPIESPLAERLAQYGSGPDEIHALQERLEEIEQQTTELADRSPEFEKHVGALADRVHALEGSAVEGIAARLEETATTSMQLDALRAQLESLAEEAGGIGAIAADVEAVRSELARLDELGRRLHAVERDSSSLEDLRTTVDALAARPVADPTLAPQVEGIAARLEEAVNTSTQMDELRAQVEALTQQAGGIGAIAGEVAAVRSELARLDELGSRLHAVETDGASLEELRDKVDALAARPIGDPDLVEQLSRRVEEVSEAGRELDELREGLASLGNRLDSVAGRTAEAVPADQITSLAERLEALESTRFGDDLTDLRHAVDELAARPTGDAALAERVEELAHELEMKAGPDPQLEALGARVGELAREASAVGGVTKDVEELRARLDDLAQLDTRLAAGLDALDGAGDAVAELRRRLDEVADRPAADAAHLEQLARRVDELSNASGHIDELRNRLDVLSSEVGTPAEDLAGLRRELAALEHRFDSVGDRGGNAVPSGEIAALATRLEALETGATEAELVELRKQMDELAARPAGDPALVERVEQLAHALEGIAETRLQLDELRARFDAVEEATAEERSDQHGPRLEAIERRLEDAEARDAALGSRFEDVTSRLVAIDELPARLDAFGEQLTAHERGHAKSVRKADLTSLRNDLVEQFDSMEKRFEELATGARKDHKSLERKVEEIVAGLTDEVGGQRRKVDDRVAAVEQDAVALRSELAELRGAADADEAWRGGVEADLQSRVEKLGKRLASEQPQPTSDLSPALDEVRAELSALATRVDGSDAVAAGELEALRAQFEERLEAETGRTVEQVRAAEEALREGLSSLGKRLAETESTYLEAGDALRRSIERLEAAMVDDDDDVTAPATDEDAATTPERPRQGPFIAFVPNGSGYSLQELNGVSPVVGEPVPVADRGGEFVVTRIGRSPLPLDVRRCAYLELRPGALASADRVP